jgi:hypothetical protein
MDKSAFQLFKDTNRTNTNAWLHNVPIIDFGRVIKVIDIQTVVVEAIIQTSLSKEIYTVTLLNLSSNLLEISDEPKLGDTVLLLFLRKHHPLVFMSETINDQNAAGYNEFSGTGILMSTAKKAAHTVISCYDDDGKPVTDITSDAEVYGTFNNSMTIEFCRAVFDSEDEQIIRLVFGAGRPLVEKHLARTEREYGFWKDPDNGLVEMDASVTERYSKYAPVTKDIQGAQTTGVGLGTDKAGNPVETDAPVVETVHGKAPVTRDIRSPQNIVVGIGNDETGEPSAQRKAPVTIEMGDDADITLNSMSGKNTRYEKDVVESVGGDRKKTVDGSVEESVAGDQKTSVGGGYEEVVTGSAKYTSADTNIKSTAPVGINDGLYMTGLQPYLAAETAAHTALGQAAQQAVPQLAVLDALSGGTGFITGLGAAIAAFTEAVKAADTSAHAALALVVK